MTGLERVLTLDSTISAPYYRNRVITWKWDGQQVDRSQKATMTVP
jgi:hypothetical protein